MASSGKKGKKNKGTVISLQSFLANGEPQPGITQVAKKVRNYGNDSDEDDGSLPQVYQLPTAPRASRIFDDDSIPHKPPFLAYISNLPFDANEEDIYEFFLPIELVSLRLPREDGETGRVRGFGYAEFETRDDLIHVISLPDPQVKNRRVRIEVSNENEQQNNQRRNAGDRNNRRNYDGFSSGENRESINWRRDKENDDNDRDGGRRGGGRNYERNFDRGCGGFNRDRAPREGSQEKGGGGSWRTGDRPAYDSSPRGGSGGGFGNDRYRDRGDRDRGDRGDRDRGDRYERNEGGRSRRNDDDVPQERPKLNLKPRTLPLPEIVSKPEPAESDVDQKQNNQDSASDSDTKTKPSRPAGIPAEKVFGSAKPVDTAAKEKQIEERLEESRRLERERRENEQKERVDDVSEKVAEVELNKDDKETRNTAISSWRRRDEDSDSVRKYSPDRRAPERRNDDRRNRDNRDFNRDNRNRDRNDRNERYNKDRPNNRDDRARDDSKQKREPKPERPMPKYQPPSSGPLLQTSNKYSGLLDDDGCDD